MLGGEQSTPPSIPNKPNQFDIELQTVTPQAASPLEERLENKEVKNTKTRVKRKKAGPVKPKYYILGHNFGRYDSIFLIRSYLQCDVESYWHVKPKLSFKDNLLVKMSLGSDVHFLDSIQIMNSSLDQIAYTMLGKKKDAGHKVGPPTTIANRMVFKPNKMVCFPRLLSA